MPNRSTPPPSDGSGPEKPGRPDLADSLEALRRATRDLEASSRRLDAGAEPGDVPSQPAGAKPQADTPGVGSRGGDDPEARAYYERLEQTGQLVDVADDADPSTLPPRVTHIRRPDGSIERIGFS